MKELFQRVLNEYQKAFKSNLTAHPIAEVLRKSLPKEISKTLIDKERFKVKVPRCWKLDTYTMGCNI